MYKTLSFVYLPLRTGKKLISCVYSKLMGWQFRICSLWGSVCGPLKAFAASLQLQLPSLAESMGNDFSTVLVTCISLAVLETGKHLKVFHQAGFLIPELAGTVRSVKPCDSVTD